MKQTASDLEEYILMTVLAELFDDTDSTDIDLLAKKITDGLEKNGLLNNEDDNEDTFTDIAAA